METLIEQLEDALEKLDTVNENLAAIKLDECISILCEKYGLERKRAFLSGF